MAEIYYVEWDIYTNMILLETTHLQSNLAFVTNGHFLRAESFYDSNTTPPRLSLMQASCQAGYYSLAARQREVFIGRLYDLEAESDMSA
jgi:hypothetical protein